MPASQRIRIVVPGDDPPQIQGSPHLERLEPYGSVALFTDRPFTLDEQLERAIGAHVIMNTRGAVKWHRDALEQLPDLRLIATCSIGTDMVDLEAARERGVVVCNQPGKIAPYVAEHIIGLMFAVAKRAAYQTAELKAGRWGLRKNVYLKEKTLGVIGTGNTGAEVARIANSLGMRVIAWDLQPLARTGPSAGSRVRGVRRSAEAVRRRQYPGEAQRRQPWDARQARVRPHEVRRHIPQRRPRRADRHRRLGRKPSTPAILQARASTYSTKSHSRQITLSWLASRSSSLRTSPTRPPKASRA